MMKNNKKRAILLLVICLALISSFAYSLDAPHSPANLQDCATCHDFYSTNPYLMTTWTGGYVMQDDDDTPLNHLCRSCHYGGGPAPAHDTHSYLGVGYATSATSPYGGWQVRCSTCHNPHYQDQAKAYLKTTDTYWTVKLLVDTVSASATASTLKAQGTPGWATDAYVDLHVIPDVSVRYPVSYQITANTSDTLTVKGEINPSAGLNGKTFAIFRGKLVRSKIKLDDILNPPDLKTGLKTVRFFNASGTKSFADGDTTYDGICEVCHTQTTHFRNTGSAPDQNHTNQGAGIPGQNCTGACHASNDGFQPSGCNTCHGYPVDAGSLISLDASGASATSDSQGPGAHVAHNTKFECTNCHTGGMLGGAAQGDNLINIGFYLNGNLGGNYDGTASRTVFNYAGAASTTVTTAGSLQCTNLYCHSTGQSSNGASAIPSSYATPAWNGAAACGTCHNVTEGTGLTTGSHGEHLGTAGVSGCSDCHTGAANDASTYNSTNHVNRLIDVANTYSAAGALGNGYGTCSTANCHADAYASGTIATPAWGSTGNGCSACHTTAIGATGPATGGHALHAETTCTLCHNAGTTSAVKPSTEHVDGDIDTNNVGYTDNKAKGSAYTTCSTASCHADVYASGTIATPVWGSTGNGCSACHTTVIGATGPATGGHALHAETTCTLCHNAGTTSATKPSTEHADGDIDTNNVGYTDNKAKGSAYTTCSTASCHADVYASGTVATPVWGSTGNGCSACHTTAIGATGPATGGHALHAETTCTLCHNAGTTSATKPSTEHADGDIDTNNVGYTDNKAKGSAYTTCSTASCHVNVYASGTIATPVWGSTGNGCSACHTTAIGATGPATGSHSAHMSATVKVNGSSIVCVNCHNAGTTSATKPSTEHADGDIDTLASVGYTDNKAKGSAFTTCSTASCHTNGQDASGTTITQKITATWGTPATCTTCHDFNGSMQPTTANHPTHLTRTGGTCVQCHNVYGDNTTEPGLNSPLHIDGLISVSSTAVLSFNYDGNGSGNHAPGAGYGSCSTVSCHGGGATRTWGQMGDSCTDCHSNLGGPTGGDRGHAFHVQTAYVGAITTSSYGDYTGNNWYSYSNTGGTPDIGCGYCHPQSDATHNNGVVNLNFASSDTGATGTLKAKNGSTETYAQTQRSSVTCSSVYCHSDGYANPGYGYQTSPEWFAGNFVGDKCDDCHGNSPASNSHDSHVVGIHYAGIYTGTTGLANTSGTANTNSHGSSSYSTTISCSTCHNATVTQTANAGNNTCILCHTDTNTPATGNEFAVIYASSTVHVNGTPDIAFNAINVKSKAQLRDNISNVADLNASWNRAASGVSYKAAGAYDQAINALDTSTMFDNVTNTCSTVACHNGNSVKWGDTGITCNNCHTDLTK